ncbi:MAG TPA: diacylglycerol kinase family protein [Casimicrobiaceae bacterium]|nr:diacylglycerol kinase family protein [Casimicrobiaceae bacterium]
MAPPVPVIVNASSHSGGAAYVASELGKYFEAAGIQIELKLVKSGKNILDAVRAAILGKPRTIIVGGGDGTLNTAAGLLIGSGIALGVLPLGTFNHFAKDLHVPLYLRRAVTTIAEGYCAQVDVGAVNDRFFLNNASLGIYPRLVKTRDLEQQRLGHGKWPAFVWAALAVLRRYPFVDVRLNIDGKSLARRAPFVFVGNNRYEMEGFRIGARAGLDGGELSLYVANRTGRLGLVRLALRALLGRLDQAADFDMAYAKHIEVQTRRERVHLATDGELLVMQSPLRFRIVPGALKVIVPGPEPAALE